MSSPHDTPPPELAGLNPQDLLRAGLESAEPGPADPDVTVRISPSQMAGSVSSAQQELPLPEELTALLPGGAYQVEGFLGQGGMGAVYKGTQIRLRRPVAIKIMRRDLGRDYDFEARFEREAQAMAKLNHPNIVSVIDFGEAGPDYLYIVMELVDGADLMDVIRGGQMTQEMALSLLPQICDALQFAHDHGIIHRDIKPSNIMLTRDGRIKMADFGLAKRFDAESTLHTKTGTGMGTPDYAAPEQFDPGANIDHRADIYALGVMIYQMITGTLPRGAWKSPSERAPVAPQWDGIVTRAMQSDPADRYQHASEVKTDVSSIPLAGTAPAIRDAGSTASKPSRAPQTKRTLSTRLWIAAAALVMALGGSYFLGLGGPAAAGIQWRTIDFAQLSDADLIQGNTNTRRENGVLRLTKLDGWRLPDFKARNVAIRATVHWEVGSTDLKLRARGQPGKLMEADSMSVHFNDRLRAVGYTRKPYGEPYLEKFPGKPGMEDGRDIVLGLTLIGSKAFLLQNDRLVGMEDHIPIDAAGDASVQAVNVLIKKLEVASLDELSEAEALKLLNLSQPAESPRPTSSPASPRPTATSPVWIDQLAGFWQGATEQFGWRRNPDGAAQVITDLPAILYYTEKGTPHHFRDQAARATMRLGESPYIQIGVRRTKESGSPSASSYKVTLSAQNRYLRLSMDVSNSEERKLADIALPEGADLNASHTLEISAIGDVISVIFDGRTLYQQPHSGCESGYPFVAARRGAVVEKFEVANLDEAKPASAATAQPGTKATATGNGWTNLLPLIQPERDSVRGQWSMDKQGLNAKRAEWAFCKIPAQDPGTDYDLRFKVTRGEGSPVAMFFAFRRGKTGGYIPVDYLNSPAPAFADGLRWATIQNLTDKNVFHPDMIKAKRQQWLPRGKQCEVLLQVREKEVIVSVNGEEAFCWPADWSKIQQRGGAGEAMFAGMTDEPVFGVGVFNCEAVFHSIEMRQAEGAVPWENLLKDPEMLSKMRQTPEGLYITHWATVERGASRSGAIRSRVTYTGAETSFRLLACKQEKQWYQAALNVDGRGGYIQYCDITQAGTTRFIDITGIQKSWLPKSLKPGEEVEAELRVEGDLLTLLLNGQVVCTGRDRQIPSGRWGASGTSDAPFLIQSLEYRDLGTGSLAPSSSATAGQTAGGTTPPDSLSPSFPPGQWVKLFTKPEDLPPDLLKPDSRVKWENGWLQFGVQPTKPVNLPAELQRNYAVRCRFRRNTVTAQTAGLVLRNGMDDLGRLSFYSFDISPRHEILLKRREGDNYPSIYSRKATDVELANLEETMEFGVVGDRQVTRIGTSFVNLSTDAHVRQGKGYLVGGGASAVRDIEVINLDGLPEAEALKLLGVDEQGNDLRAAAAGQWQEVRTLPRDKVHFLYGAEFTGEGIRLPTAGSRVGLHFNIRDGAIRARGINRGEKICLALREDAKLGAYDLGVRPNGTLSLGRTDPASKSRIALREFSLGKPLADGQAYEVELRAVGTTLTVIFDGKVLGTVSDETLAEGGGVLFLAEASQPATFQSLELLLLDPPAADAAARSQASASKSSPAPSSQPVWNPLLGQEEWKNPRTPGVENIGGVLHLKDSATVLTRPQPGLDGGGATKSEEQTVPTNASSAGPSVTPSSATKEAPFINSLGMKFVPVPGTDILLCIHETRRQDYTVYSNEVSTVDTTWKDVKDHLQLVGGEPDHPVVAVSWNEAREYLRWLSVKERRVYRLPTDREWSNAVGIAEKENRGPGVTPRQLFETVPQDYPWGGLYPPSQGSLAGNYGDITYRERTDPRAPTIFEDYRDGFATTAPVMSFKPNKLGLYDLGGNVWEWVYDLFDAGPEALRVMRGGSYQGNDAFRNMTASSGRRAYGTTKHLNFCGFRVALDLKGSQ